MPFSRKENLISPVLKSCLVGVNKVTLNLRLPGAERSLNSNRGGRLQYVRRVLVFGSSGEVFRFLGSKILAGGIIERRVLNREKYRC
jgi:hypothetical protein